MGKMTDHIRDFAKSRRISTDGWTITTTDSVLMVARIGSRDHAGALSDYLAGRGMLATVTMGDRRGESWAVMARLHGAPLDDGE